MSLKCSSSIIKPLNRSVAMFNNSNIFREKEHRTCLNDTVKISNVKHMFTNVFFPNVDTLFLDKCNKHFVFYNLHQHIFPNLKILYINSHPGKFATVHRFAKEDEYIVYITPKLYHNFFGKWWDENFKYIREISDTDYANYLNNLEKVQPIFEPTFKEARIPNNTINEKYFS